MNEHLGAPSSLPVVPPAAIYASKAFRMFDELPRTFESYVGFEARLKSKLFIEMFPVAFLYTCQYAFSSSGHRAQD